MLHARRAADVAASLRYKARPPDCIVLYQRSPEYRHFPAVQACIDRSGTLLKAKGRYPMRQVLLWVGKSAIAGRGLFTAQAITRGRRIIQYTGEKITKEESARRVKKGNGYIFELNERSDIDGKARANKARFINHSCEPNCIVETTSRTIWIVAGRDISAGEELTYNYGYGPDSPQHPCTCGAANCCGSILSPLYQEVSRESRDR